MEFEKSERNQRLCEQYRLFRKQLKQYELLKKQGRPEVQKDPPPRFDKRIELSPVPEGQVRVKFFGGPLLLPSREEGEELVGRSPFTQRQIEALQIAAEQRNKQ